MTIHHRAARATRALRGRLLFSIASASFGLAFTSGCVAPVANEAQSDEQDSVTTKLNTKVAPGGNFDLSLWQLQLPTGSTNSPKTVNPSALKGPNGYQDSYFYTDTTDGAMTFWDPENGVHTPNSSFARSELREMNSNGSAANWSVSGTHTLSATVKVTKVPSSVCVGQIHIGSALKSGLAPSTKPLLELYYHKNGDIVLGIEDSPSGGQTPHTLDNVPLNTAFSYVIQLTGGKINVSINGEKHSFTMPSSFTGYGEYFKVGDYDQTAGSSASVGATVKVYALAVSHSK